MSQIEPGIVPGLAVDFPAPGFGGKTQNITKVSSLSARVASPSLLTSMIVIALMLILTFSSGLFGMAKVIETASE